MDDQRGWYYAIGIDDFPQFSEQRLNNYSGPFPSEREAWISYIENRETRINRLTDERDYFRHQLESVERKLREESVPISKFLNRAMSEIPNLTDDEKRAVNRAWKDSVYSSCIGTQIVLSLTDDMIVPILREPIDVNAEAC